MRHLVAAGPHTRRIAATVATVSLVAGLVGVAAFCWVIVGDLFTSFGEALPLPDSVYVAGPLMFQVGLLVLLVQQVFISPRGLPYWSPLLVFVGFVPIAVNLDLLPLGALLILAGLAPLTRSRRQGVRMPPRQDRVA
jgi:hypothetical protein